MAAVLLVLLLLVIAGATGWAHRPVASGKPDERPRLSRTYHAGTSLVTWWTRRYTRHVDPAAAERRRSEVDLELWEFEVAKDRYDWSGLRAALTLIARTLLGARQDLRWRRSSGAGTAQAGSVHLMSARRRTRTWVPLQLGHTFDQTNGPTDHRAGPHPFT